jgi:hypothetical protein
MNRNEVIKRIICFYSSDILAVYKNQSDKYEVTTDYFEGKITVRSDYYLYLEKSSQKPNSFKILFGFRTKRDGELAVAAYLPDIDNTPLDEKKKWEGFLLEDDVFTDDPDIRFELFIRRYLEGDWGVDNGVLAQIKNTVVEINAMTEMVLGDPLFEFEENVSLIFPIAENDHRYQDAHKEAYGYLIDGLRKSAIEKLGQRLGITLNICRDKTLKALRQILPQNLQVDILDPFKVVSEKRRYATHEVREPAERFPAFDKFNKDMEAVLKALNLLRDFIEQSLGVTVESCKERKSALASLPKIDAERIIDSFRSIAQFPVIKGKTVEKVEFGFREFFEGVHDSEMVIIYFTDGCILSIDTGSNAANLEMAPEDFRVDFCLNFVPPLKPLKP